jgi:predicted P-loop ATPase
MLFDVLAGGSKFFSDSLKTFDGQKAQEGVRGKWILEIAEMQTLDKTNVNAAKGFVTQRSDFYRPAYGEETKEFPRQCVFFGTSNDDECLRDPTGGRRFWPMDASEAGKKKQIENLVAERDQIWAEAVIIWRSGELLYLPPELEAIAAQKQEAHREKHPWEDVITEFLSREVPADWSTWDLFNRLNYWDGIAKYSGEMRPRDRVCVAEIWKEALRGDAYSRIKLADKKSIAGVLDRLPGWKKCGNVIRFGSVYGVQRGYLRV